MSLTQSCVRCLARETTDYAMLGSPGSVEYAGLCAPCIGFLVASDRDDHANPDTETCAECGEPARRGYGLGWLTEGPGDEDRTVRAPLCQHCYDRYVAGVEETEAEEVTE